MTIVTERGCSKLKDAVRDQIEELRLQMQKIALNKVLTDPRVLEVSEKLDILIHEFYLDQRKKKQF